MACRLERSERDLQVRALRLTTSVMVAAKAAANKKAYTKKRLLIRRLHSRPHVRCGAHATLLQGFAEEARVIANMVGPA